MTERYQISLNQTYIAGKLGTEAHIPLRVRAVMDDGRVVLCPRYSTRTAIIATRELLENGGEINVGGRMGTLIFSPRIGGNLDTRG